MEKSKKWDENAVKAVVKGYLDMFFSILIASVAAGFGLIVGKKAAHYFIKADKEG